MDSRFTKKESGLGIASLVLGIIGLVASCIFIGIIFDILAIIFGIIVITKKMEKKGFAIAGLILGIIGAIVMIFMVFFVALTPSDKNNHKSEVKTVQSAASTERESKTSTQEDTSAKAETESKQSTETETKKDTETQTSEANKSNDTSSSNQSEHFEVDLTAGNYIVGKDIPTGTYNLKATSGQGNVSSSNMYSGGLNEVMGTPADDFAQETFNGAKFTKNVVVQISSSLVLHISSDNADVSKVKARSSVDQTPINLSAGNYTAGTDFPAGIYNVVAASSTSGNVSSSNLYNGGLNEVIGANNDGLSIKQFNNAILPTGTTLTVSGTSIQLIPVGQ